MSYRKESKLRSQIRALGIPKLWEYKIKVRGGFRCEICGSVSCGLDAAHIIDRRHLWTAWDLRNGIAVCRDCHNELAIMGWLFAKDPQRYWWILEQRRTVHQGWKIDPQRILEELKAAYRIEFKYI